MPFFSFLDDDSLLRDLVLQRPKVLGRYQPMAQSVMCGTAELSQADREMIGAYVSALNDCSYCYGAHRATAEALGVDGGLIESLIESIDDAPVSEKMKPLVRYMKKLTETPAKLTESDARAVIEAGWSEEALSDAIIVCAKFNMANRLVDGHGLNRHLSGAIVAEIAARLSTTGYEG
jgi:uncharacterized peroxidase-related enzyme